MKSANSRNESRAFPWSTKHQKRKRKYYIQNKVIKLSKKTKRIRKFYTWTSKKININSHNKLKKILWCAWAEVLIASTWSVCRHTRSRLNKSDKGDQGVASIRRRRISVRISFKNLKLSSIIQATTLRNPFTIESCPKSKWTMPRTWSNMSNINSQCWWTANRRHIMHLNTVNRTQGTFSLLRRAKWPLKAATADSLWWTATNSKPSSCKQTINLLLCQANLLPSRAITS